MATRSGSTTASYRSLDRDAYDEKLQCYGEGYVCRYVLRTQRQTCPTWRALTTYKLWKRYMKSRAWQQRAWLLTITFILVCVGNPELGLKGSDPFNSLTRTQG